MKPDANDSSRRGTVVRVREAGLRRMRGATVGLAAFGVVATGGIGYAASTTEHTHKTSASKTTTTKTTTSGTTSSGSSSTGSNSTTPTTAASSSAAVTAPTSSSSSAAAVSSGS